MLSSRHFKSLVPVAVIATVAGFSNPSSAGIISILKRGQASTASVSLQKVAFVGCAKVKETSGDVERLAGIEKWERLTRGTHLEEGDVVRTGDDGRLILQMCESDSLVRVTPETTVRLVPLKKGWDECVLSGREAARGYVLRSIEGKAFYKDGAGAWEPLAVNVVLPSGTLVRSPDQARISVFNTERKQAAQLLVSKAVPLVPRNGPQIAQSIPASRAGNLALP